MAIAKYAEWLEEKNLELLTAWAKEGLDFSQIAKNMGVSESTLREWRKNHPAISAALKHGRAHAIAEVENALHKRALGYTVELKKAIKVKVIDYDPQTQRKIREREEIAIGVDEMHVPADTTAQIFYLTNRKPEAWKRNRPEVISDGEDGTGVIIIEEASERGTATEA